jgi:hypothetical protein
VPEIHVNRLASPTDAGIRSAETRCRNTQYVQPWYAITSGAKISAAQVMIFSVYGLDDAL